MTHTKSENYDQNTNALGLVVGVGASAGGLDALNELFSDVPKNAGIAFIIVQHTAPNYGTMLASILQPRSALPVEPAQDRAKLLPNHIYIAPAEHDLIIENGVLRLVSRTLTHRLHLPVDTFFCSLAQAFGSRAVGIVLSGTGNDGTFGLQDIKAADGITFAQDEQSAKDSGMPKSAISAGHVDYVLSPAGIAAELTRLASQAQNLAAGVWESKDRAITAEILTLLRNSFGIDFTDYKQTTVSRRIQKRLNTAKLKSLTDYVEVLRTSPDELEALYRDILINVTSFFRDPEMFDALETLVFPKITEGRGPDDPIRIWVPGCSSGEEVYSLAIRLAEYIAKSGHSPSVQFFGTDISEPSLAKARAGIYPLGISSLVSPERLRNFFDPVEGGYQIKKSLRDSCVFARQNVIADPPLSRMDLISCRNLLIYFGPALQERTVPIFHYALKPSNGFLVLGKSELVDVFSDFFIPVEKIYKLYRKKDIPLRLPYQPIPGHRVPLKTEPVKTQDSAHSSRDTELDVQGEIDRFILANFSPSTVVVTENADIIQFRGHTAPYLDPSGRASFNLFKMLHQDLSQSVRQAIDKAKMGDARVIRCNQLRYKTAGDVNLVNVQVVPLRTPTLKQRYFLVIFEETQTGIGKPTVQKTESKGSNGTEIVPISEIDEIRRLTEELEDTRQHLQVVLDERDIGLGELHSANEEVTSSNEELQTINQELETAKEELQASNEELTTLNEQLRHNLELLRKSEAQFRVLFSGIKDYAIFMLDQMGNVLSENEGAEKITGYSKQEIVGQHFSVFYPEEERRAGKPEKELAIAASTGRYEEEGLRVRKDGRTFLANVIVGPLYAEDGKLFGFAKVTRDITEQKRAEENLRLSELRFRQLVYGVKDYAIYLIDPKGYVLTWNEGAERIKGYKPAEIIGQHFSKFYSREEATNGTTERELQIAQTAGKFECEGWRFRKDGTKFWAHVLISEIRDEKGELFGFSKVTRDLTERREAEVRIREIEERNRLIVDITNDAFVTMNVEGQIIDWNPKAEAIFGWSRQEAIGRPFSETIIPIKDRERYEKGLAKFLKTGESQIVNKRIELTALHRDGREFPAELTISPLLIGAGYFFCLFIHDNSERKRLQKAESEKEAAELANKAKSAFLANMSHEIRTPLTAIVGFTEFLADDPSLQPQTIEYIKSIERNAKHLSSLVSEVLDLSKVEANQMDVNKVSTPLFQVMDTVVSMLRTKGAEKGLAIKLIYETPVPETIWTDPVRLKQILFNIIDNSIKFTDAGTISLLVKLSKPRDREGHHYLAFTVTDTGCGIATDKQGKIFKPFMQAMEPNSRYTGTGLGLSLSRQLAKLLGGDVELTRSELGKGSTFTITVDPGSLEGVRIELPRRQGSDNAVSRSTREASRELVGVRVLLVEDTIDNQVLIQQMLKSGGGTTTVANNGEEGVRVAMEGDFDVILMDMRMPVLDGYGATIKLREKGFKVPIIAITAHATKEERERSFAAGCDDYLTKPIRSAELRRVVAKWAEKTERN